MNEEMQGRILAYLDGELAAGERREFEREAERSAELSAGLERARERTRLVRHSLGEERVAVPDSAMALRRVRRRLEEEPVKGRHGWLRRDLARAAGIALLVGATGLSAAVPGSPVRAWLEGLLQDPTPPAATEPAATAPTATAPVGETAIHVDAPSPGLRIVVQALPAGAELSVRTVPGRTLSVYAPEGSRFLTGSDRVVVRAATGPVRIELPAALQRATLQLEEEIILEMTDGRVSAPAFAPDHRGYLVHRAEGG